jgi:hypothetical protein
MHITNAPVLLITLTSQGSTLHSYSRQGLRSVATLFAVPQPAQTCSGTSHRACPTHTHTHTHTHTAARTSSPTHARTQQSSSPKQRGRRHSAATSPPYHRRPPASPHRACHLQPGRSVTLLYSNATSSSPGRAGLTRQGNFPTANAEADADADAAGNKGHARRRRLITRIWRVSAAVVALSVRTPLAYLPQCILDAHRNFCF